MSSANPAFALGNNLSFYDNREYGKRLLLRWFIEPPLVRDNFKHGRRSTVVQMFVHHEPCSDRWQVVGLDRVVLVANLNPYVICHDVPPEQVNENQATARSCIKEQAFRRTQIEPVSRVGTFSPSNRQCRGNHSHTANCDPDQAVDASTQENPALDRDDAG